MTKEDVEKMRKEMVFHTINFTLVRELDYNYLAADLFQYICYWVLYNEEENKNYRDGKYWTYFSANDLVNMEFKGISKWTVQRAIWVLTDMELVKVGDFNDKKSNRALWYTVDKNDIEFWQPNLIKLFKKKGRKGASSAVQNCTDAQSEGGAELHQDNSKIAPTVVQNCTDSLYISNNNHTNNHSTNQEKNNYLNNQHHQDDGCGDEGCTKSEHPLDAKTWSKYAKRLPKGTFDDTQAAKVRELIDRYGEEKVDEFVAYVAKDWPEVTTIPKFVDTVTDQLSMAYYDAKRKGKSFGKISNEYRLNW